jgi:hypothetical protein
VNHVAALREAWDADLSCALVIAAALAAPLLEPLSAPNFGVHLSGESSTGKTSMLRIGGSVYGDPHDPQWLASWNATGAGAELRAAMLSDLPQCYDEIGGGEPEALDRMVYMLINGTGRTRAQRDLALRETQHWRTVLISTGERDLMSDTSATGVRTRIINVPVAGFGSLSPTAIDRLRALCAANAGNFGQHGASTTPTIWRNSSATHAMRPGPMASTIPASTRARRITSRLWPPQRRWRIGSDSAIKATA